MLTLIHMNSNAMSTIKKLLVVFLLAYITHCFIKKKAVSLICLFDY